MTMDTSHTDQLDDIEYGISYESAEERSESLHKEFGLALITFLVLIILTILAIWIFKHYKIKLFHETGVAMIMGIILGLAIHLIITRAYQKERYPILKTCNLEEELAVTKDDLIWILDEAGTTLEVSVRQQIINPDVAKDKDENLFLFNTEIFFYILLPPIIFHAGYSMKKRHFFRNIASLLTYAFVGTAISCFVVGGVLYAYIQLGLEQFPENISIVHTLLFGSLISATDPVTVLAIFHDLHVDVDLYALVFGESVMNDAVAIVLYGAIDQYEQNTSGTFELSPLFISIAKFIIVFLGSFALGLSIGLLTAIITKITSIRNYDVLESSLFVIFSYMAFILADSIGLTGIVAILFCGITQSHYSYINLSPASRKKTKDFFELLNFISENFLFSYMGVSLFIYPYHQWKPGFIGFAFIAIAVGRILNIIPISILLNLRRRKKIAWTFQAMLIFAGLRGAIAFALAIRNTDTEIRQLIYTTTLVIVIVTIVVCGGLTYFALVLLKIKVGVKEERVLNEEGELIQYDPMQGNYLISKFSSLDKNYLIPFFTIRGRHLEYIFPKCCGIFARFFDRNKTTSPGQLGGIAGEDSTGSFDEQDTNGDRQEESVVFDRTQQITHGDIGMGNDPVDIEAGGLNTTSVSSPTPHEGSIASIEVSK